MSDVANLTIKTNAEKAKQEIKGLGNELVKTGSAGETLVGTLKNIGLTIGFSYLIKQAAQLNTQLSAINNKFKTIFGSGKIDGLNTLMNDFNMTESGAKRVLSTIGQFATGLGQSGQYVRQFSTDLAKAAADYAAWAGLPDVNEVAKKFAKATLGETGELKDIGIVIDTQSEAFKRLTAEIQASTHASEAQAKQMAIAKSILEQVGNSSGSAAKQSTDLWTQAKVTLQALNEILGRIGGIFSTIFGPLLANLNAVLKFKFVQVFIAWSVSIGLVLYGINKLTSALRSTTKQIKELSQDEVLRSSLLKKFYGEYIENLERVKELQEKIQDILEERDAILKEHPGASRKEERDTEWR